MKAQIFSLDIVFALAIFFIVIGLIMYFWFIMPTESPSFSVQDKANMVADNLITKKIGNENILECEKVTALASKNYNETRNELGCREYELFVEFKNTTKVCNGNKLNIGNSTNATYTASVVRIVYLDNQKMQMIVRLYD